MEKIIILFEKHDSFLLSFFSTVHFLNSFLLEDFITLMDIGFYHIPEKINIKRHQLVIFTFVMLYYCIERYLKRHITY